MLDVKAGDSVVVTNARDVACLHRVRVMRTTHSSIKVSVPGRGVLSFGRRTGRLWGYASCRSAPLALRIPGSEE